MKRPLFVGILVALIVACFAVVSQALPIQCTATCPFTRAVCLALFWC